MNNKENNIKNSENGRNTRNINTKNTKELNKDINDNITDEKETEAENDTEKLSQSLKNLLIMNKNFAEPVVIVKENKLFTDFHYATFKNSYGENTCYINVILHLLYNIDQLEEFIVSLYEIDESNKISDESNNKTTPEESNDTYKFLVQIGKILHQYREIIFYDENENQKYSRFTKKNQVTIINTYRMRKLLEKVSNEKFPLNNIADPVEFFSFILDILNEYLTEDIHKTFYLELIDEYTCNKIGCSKIENKYDKDNFMYHIYIDEILKYIEKENIKVNEFKNKLFEFSHNLFLSENTKICEKCKGKMNHNLICKNLPDYILINCVWKESNPIVDDAMTIFFMMPIKDEFNNLFINQTRKYKKKIYQLFGFVLYSFTLSHYIICIYNIDKDVFVLLNDEIVKEFHNLYELLIEITVEELKLNGKAFFYPVMLIYTKDVLYEEKNKKINTLNDSEYKIIINKCNEAIYQYEIQNKIDEETESNNYKEFIKEQKEIENQIKKRSLYESYLHQNDKQNNKFDNKKTEINKILNHDKENKQKNKTNDGDENDRINNENKNNHKNENKIINKNRIEEEKAVTNNDIKKGLEQKNIGTIGKILKDLKSVNGNNLSSQIYIGDLMKSQNNNQLVNNINNKTRIRTNYFNQPKIIWNNRPNKNGNEIQNMKINDEENQTKNETAINPKKVRFHRKASTDNTNFGYKHG